MFENPEGAVRRTRGGKEKQGTDWVQSDIRAFGIAGDWETKVLEADMSDKTVTKVGGGLWPRGGNKR